MLGGNLIEVNISGAFTHFDKIALFFFKNKSLLEKYKVTVYDGVNNCMWNGGRINREVFYSEKELEYYYNNNISIALTFSNDIIDIEDKLGNHLLKEFHRDGNKIILVNESLRKHVREHFPLYSITHSITGLGSISVPMSEDDLDRYRSLEEKYDVIVPRSEHIFDKAFLGLDRKKYEIMLNDTCVYNCKHYGEHFKKIAEKNRVVGNPFKIFGKKVCTQVEECWIPGFNFDVGDLDTIAKYKDDYGMDLKKKQIHRLLGLGFNKFKISGRELDKDVFANEIESWLLGKLY